MGHKKILSDLIRKKVGRTEKYKPYEYGKKLYVNGLVINGHDIHHIEVFSDIIWFISDEYDGYHVTETLNGMTEQDAETAIRCLSA